MATLETAIVAGGDTDSVGALTGALSGAYLGTRQLPPAFVGLIEDQGMRGAGVAHTATALYAISVSDSDTNIETPLTEDHDLAEHVGVAVSGDAPDI